MKALARFSDPTYALLRIVAGFLFGFHGLQILTGWQMPMHVALGSQLWVGGLIELVGGLAILLGLQTRLAALLCSGTMAVAYVQFHWKFAFGTRFWPALNQGEMALVYAFLFLFVACRGGVRWCVDKTD